MRLKAWPICAAQLYNLFSIELAADPASATVPLLLMVAQTDRTGQPSAVGEIPPWKSSCVLFPMMEPTMSSLWSQT